MAITGAYEALPRGTILPRRFPLRIAVGRPVEFREYEQLTDTQALELLTERLNGCFQLAQSLRS
jgi:hypothetical protein